MSQQYIEELENTLQKLELQNQHSRETVHKAYSLIDTLNQQLALKQQTHSIYTTLQQQNHSLQIQIQTLQQQNFSLQQQIQTLQTLQQQNLNLQNQTHILHTENQKLRNQNQIFQQQVIQINKQLTSKQFSLSKTNKKSKTHFYSQEYSKQVINKILNQQQLKQKQISIQLQESNNLLNQTTATWIKAIQKIKQQGLGISEQNRKLQTEIKNLKYQKEVLIKIVKEYEQEIKKYQNLINGYEAINNMVMRNITQKKIVDNGNIVITSLNSIIEKYQTQMILQQKKYNQLKLLLNQGDKNLSLCKTQKQRYKKRYQQIIKKFINYNEQSLENHVSALNTLQQLIFNSNKNQFYYKKCQQYQAKVKQLQNILDKFTSIFKKKKMSFNEYVKQ